MISNLTQRLNNLPKVTQWENGGGVTNLCLLSSGLADAQIIFVERVKYVVSSFFWPVDTSV